MRLTKDSSRMARSMVTASFVGATEPHMKAIGKTIMPSEKEHLLKMVQSTRDTSKTTNSSEGITLRRIKMRYSMDNSKIRNTKAMENFRSVACTSMKVVLSIT